MLRNRLLAEVAALREHTGLAWRQCEDGTPMVARIIDAGLRAVGLRPGSPQERSGGCDVVLLLRLLRWPAVGLPWAA